MNKNDVKTQCKYKRWISFFWGSWKYERNGSRAKLTWRPLGVTYFARDPLRSYFHEPQKNEIYFLNEPRWSKIGSSKVIVSQCKYLYIKQITTNLPNFNVIVLQNYICEIDQF